MSLGTRASLGLQVLAVSALAVAAAVLVMEVSDRFYKRVDLSLRGRNTVDPATLERLENLADELVIETFFRPLKPPYTAVTGDALRRVAEYLFLVSTAERGSVELVHHDLADAAAAQQRQRELGVEGENLFVVRYRGRRAAVSVFGEAAVIHWGNPTVDDIGYLSERGIANVVDPRTWRPGVFEPARLVAMRTEEAFAEAVARVSAEGAPRVYFSHGQGERDPEGTLATSVRLLAEELARDGFERARWDPEADGAVPKDCDVLAILGPAQPFRPEHLDYVRDYLAGGGRLIAAVAPEALGPDTLAALLEEYGLRFAPGVVCQEVTGPLGELVEGLPQCAVLMIDAAGMAAGHPVTEALRRRERRLLFSNTSSFERGASPQGGEVIDLLFSSPESWRDLIDKSTGAYNYALDQSAGERKGRQTLAALAQFRVPAAGDGMGPDAPAAGGEVRRARVLAVASASFFADAYFAKNRDFLRGAFNWMAERDYRVDVTPRGAEESTIDVARGTELATLGWLVWLALPGTCAALGGLVAWRRRR